MNEDIESRLFCPETMPFDPLAEAIFKKQRKRDKDADVLLMAYAEHEWTHRRQRADGSCASVAYALKAVDRGNRFWTLYRDGRKRVRLTRKKAREWLSNIMFDRRSVVVSKKEFAV